MAKRIRVLITKVGLDSHERGAMLVATALKDAGIEVVYLGSFQTPESIVKSAIQEDVSLIGISCHCGEHLTLVPLVLKLMTENKLENIPVIVGGVIPKEDASELKAAGVKGIFVYGTTMDQIVQYIQGLCSGDRKEKKSS